MVRIHKICPFSHTSCVDCTFYRGRHYYADFQNKHENCTDFHTTNFSFDKVPLIQFSKSYQNLNLSHAQRALKEPLPDISLKVINLVTEETSNHDLSEAKTWEWNNSDVQRFINGTLHITSWEQLEDYSRRKSERGEKEIVIYESPGYILVSGG